MIGVGINKNVVLLGAALDEQTKRLVLSFDYKDNLNKQEVDIFDRANTAAVDSSNTVFKLNLFPFKAPTGPKNENKTEDEKVQMVSDDMGKVKSQLTQLLLQYMNADQIKWDAFVGTGIDRSNYRQRYLDDASVGLIFENYAKQFIQMVTPFLGKPEYALRMKLVRQSKDKHFAAIPGRFLDERPWVDLMDVPDANTKVMFSPWEISNGLNDGTPVAKSQADNIPEAAAETTEAPFGSR